MDQLRELLTTDSPALERLFPPPYGDDVDRNQGYAAVAHPELIEHRLAALDVVERSADATELDEDQLNAWMRSVNDLRLVLGTILEVTEDGEAPEVDPDSAATYAGLRVPRLPARPDRARPVGLIACGPRPRVRATSSFGGVRSDCYVDAAPRGGWEPPSSSGLGRLPFKEVTRVRIPLGVRSQQELGKASRAVQQ